MKTSWLLLALALAPAGCGTSSSACDPEAPNTICTIAGSTKNEGYKGDGGPATKAVLYIPMDSAIAPNGEVWFIDFNNYVVRAIDSNGDVRTVVGDGQLGDSPASDGLTQIQALQAHNNHTPTMTFHDGYLYLAAWHESRIKRVDLSQMMMTNFVGRGVRTYYDGDGGPALMAGIDLPSSITFDPAGNVVFTDQGNLVVRKVDMAAGTVSTIVGQCVVDFTPCAPGVQPTQCPGSDRLVCGDPTTQCTQTCRQTFYGDGGPATLARLNLPYTQAADPTGRVAYTSTGDLIIADTGNNRIRKVDTSGTITTIAGNGTAGFAGDGGVATQAELNHPVDLAIAPDDTIYFSDVFNHCVRKIDPSGTISTVVGRCHASSNGEGGKFGGDGGPPLQAELNRPYGIDLAGNKLYVSDSYNNRLRVVNLP